MECVESLAKSLAYSPRQHFNNERYEVAQYDKHLKEYESSSVKITTSLAYLNSGQNIIFSTALTATMFLAAQGVLNGLTFLIIISTPVKMVFIQGR